ncbi:MAG: DeoR/GlpR transcriptional regulator [Candidatus Promineofilum sp.]|nr:DeoR/GlpR transcriptional regulator [Promineifilum sp.]
MSENLPQMRRDKIVEWLAQAGTLSIEQLARQLAVSTMTIHRDLDRLAADGLARKVRGGVVAVDNDAADVPSRARCALCGKRPPRRTAWVITPEGAEALHACCAHCGLLLLGHTAGNPVALATDFLYGRMVNAYQATYVMDSDIGLCCVPGVLCFATSHDAERYGAGFGGRRLTYDEALPAVGDAHRHH